MIKQLSMNITSFLVQENIIEEDKVEIYSYGFKHIFNNLITISFICIIAGLFSSWLPTLLFFAGFMPFRVIAGGYHAKSYNKCNIISLIVYITNLYLIRLVNPYMKLETYIIMSVFLIVTIFIYAPVDNKNRVLDTQKYDIAKRKSRMASICLTASCIVVALFNRECNLLITSVLMGAITASVSIVVGSYVREGERNEEV